MKNTRSRLPQDTLRVHLEAAFPLDPRRLTVFAALILVLIEQRTVYLARLVTCVRLPDTGETIYQRLKRFVRFNWTTQQEQTARFILQHFQQESEVLLVIDRTNWAWGKQSLNLLVVSILWRAFSFPLAWTVLPHGGSTDMQRRIKLIEAVMSLLIGKRVLLLADREFIGGDWFQALKRLGVQPTIRLLATTRVGGNPVWACFKRLAPGELRIWSRAVNIYGIQMRVFACKNLAGETLYLAYHGVGKQAIARYAWRWNVENMHQRASVLMGAVLPKTSDEGTGLRLGSDETHTGGAVERAVRGRCPRFCVVLPEWGLPREEVPTEDPQAWLSRQESVLHGARCSSGHVIQQAG